MNIHEGKGLGLPFTLAFTPNKAHHENYKQDKNPSLYTHRLITSLIFATNMPHPNVHDAL